MTARWIAFAIALMVFLTAARFSCSNASENCVCTAEFRVYPLTVVDAAGEPVNEVSLEVVNLRTDRRLVSTFLGLPTPGTFWIVDDAMRDEFSVGGDSVRVSGASGSLSFVTGFRFSLDECGCHVHQLTGPDTVTIR